MKEGAMEKRRYVPRNPRWFNRVLKRSFGQWLLWAFKVRSTGLEVFEGQRPPYVIVSNHVMVNDFFIISRLVPEPLWWVATDAHFRGSALRAVLGLVGAIPKSKAIPDFITIDTIVKVVRRRKGVIGLFPEGQQSWDGRTLPLIPSTAKLLKLLKVPVFVAKTEGGWASLPRWAWKRRRGGMTIAFSKLFDGEDLAEADATAIERSLEGALRHDELAWLESRGSFYPSRRRAERLELALFMCPSCSGIGTMASEGEKFRCRSCGAAQLLDGRYRFRRLGASEPRFGDPREWMEWQASAIGLFAFEAVASKKGSPLFSDEGVRLFRGKRMNPLHPVARGRLDLYFDRMELVVGGQTHLVFSLGSIDGTGVLTRQTFEFYVGMHLYRVTYPQRSVSALKWQLAVEALKRELA